MEKVLNDQQIIDNYFSARALAGELDPKLVEKLKKDVLRNKKKL